VRSWRTGQRTYIGQDVGKAACVEIEIRFTLHEGICPPLFGAIHSGHPAKVLESKFFISLEREIWLARDLRGMTGSRARTDRWRRAASE
jgi:hypothetical protein